MRKRRGDDPGRTRSLDPEEEQEWVEREEERERRETEVERERLAGLVQVAKQRYERAVEKLGMFTGETAELVDAGGEGTELAPPTPAAGVGTEDVPDYLGVQTDRLSLSAQATVHPPDRISHDDPQPGRPRNYGPGDMMERMYRTPSPPTPEGSLDRYLSPFLSALMTSRFAVPHINPWFQDADVDPDDNSTPSPPSANSAADCDRWCPATSVPPSPIRGYKTNPLLSQDARQLAEETSVVLELLSRTGEIDMDDDAQTKSIEQAFNNVVKLRREYRVTLASRAGEEARAPTPDEDWDGKCIICCDDIADIVLTPCHHMVMCEVCRLSVLWFIDTNYHASEGVLWRMGQDEIFSLSIR